MTKRKPLPGQDGIFAGSRWDAIRHFDKVVGFPSMFALGELVARLEMGARPTAAVTASGLILLAGLAASCIAASIYETVKHRRRRRSRNKGD